MALEVTQGSFQWLTSDTAGTTYDITTPSTAKAMYFYCVGIQSATDAFSTTTNSKRSIGFAVSTSSRRSVATHSTDAAGNADCGSIARNDSCLCQVSGAGADNGRLDVNSISSTTTQIIVDVAATQSVTVFYTIWSGSDITVAEIGDIAEPAATGTQNYTVTGFTSDGANQIIFAAGVQSVSALNTGEGQDSGLNVGWATGTGGGATKGGSIVGNSDDGSATMDTDSATSDAANTNTYVIQKITIGGGSFNATAYLSAWGTDLFTLNWDARGTTNRRNIFLAIKGGNWAAGITTLNFGTIGNTATVSGLSFTPIGLDLICSPQAPTHDWLTFGQGTSTANRKAIGVFDFDAGSSAEIAVSVQYDQVLTVQHGGGASYADIDEITSDGFRLIVDSAGISVTPSIIYLAYASESAGVTTTPSAGSITYGGLAPVPFVLNPQVTSPGEGAIVYTGAQPTPAASQSTLPGAGAVVYAGQIPTESVTQNVLTTPGAGAFAYAGAAPTVALTQNVWTSPDVGALTYSGQTPTPSVGANVTVLPDAGSIAYGGLTPAFTVTANVFTSPAVGAISYGGLTPTLSATANVWTTPSAGVIAYGGLTPVLSATSHVWTSPAAGSIEYSGQVPSPVVAARTWVLPGAGAIDYAGQIPAPLTTANVFVATNVGAIAYAGQTPTPSATGNVWTSPDAGSLVYAGQQPVPISGANVVIQTPAGSVVYAGQIPSFQTTGNVWTSPAAGALAYSGQVPAPSVTANLWTLPGVGSIAYAGQTPVELVTANIVISPSPGAISYEGKTPLAQTSANIWVSTQAGAIVYEGHVPSFGAGISVTPANGAVVYEGLAPLLAQTFDQITVPGSGFIQYTGLRPDIVVTGQLVEEEPTGGGNWGGVRKSARRRPIRIKYSDFDTQEKYAAALAAAAMPIARVTDTGEMIAPAAPDLIHDYDDDDDVILKAVLLRVLEYAR